MFERFSDRARKVMGLARQEAQRFNHQYIGTEHILLGLIQEGSGVAANVLRNLDVDPEKIRVEVEKGPTMVSMGQLPLTPSTKRLLDCASAAATRLASRCIDTEHLLLGILDEGSGAAVKALINAGLNLEEIRVEILETIGAPPFPHLPSPPKTRLFDGYQEFTRTTAIYPGSGTGRYDAMCYVGLKLAGESGEFTEKLGKLMRSTSIEALSRENMTSETRLELVKELGDVLWYVAAAASELGLPLSEVVRVNVDKLTSRKKRGVIDGKGDNR